MSKEPLTIESEDSKNTKTPRVITTDSLELIDESKRSSIDETKKDEETVSVWRKIFPKTPYQSPREKTFVRKLDIWLLTWTSIAYLMKSIDQSNISNAYVSGMKEDLNFQGKQYNYLDTYFKVGYAIFIIPSQIMLNKVKPAYWLSSCELIWGALTSLCAVAKKPSHLYPIRFFIGVLESSSWPGIINILMNYYTKEELATRIGIFQASYYLGNIVTGFMQASIHSTLDGKLGRPGWAWMFIINGIMTLVVAFSGYFVVPDTPANGGARFWMNDEDRKLSLERMERVGRQTARKVTLKEVYTTFLDWRMWLFIVGYCAKAYCVAFQYFNLFLKSLTRPDGTKVWSVSQLNMIPIGGNAISLFAVIFWAKLSDLTQKPLHVIIFLLFTDFFAVIVLTIWPKGNGIKYAAFFMIPLSDAVTALLISLLAEVYTYSAVKRAIVTGTAVVLVYANNAWLPLLLWPADQAPTYKYGYKFSIGFIFISFTAVNLYYHFVYKRAVIKNKEEAELRNREEAGVVALDEDTGLYHEPVSTVISENKENKSGGKLGFLNRFW